jgi:hypothetical protein
MLVMQRARLGKYGARVTQTAAGRFPSALEADVWAHLALLVTAGVYRDLVRQPRVLLCCGIRWFVDFAVTEVETGATRYIESKGFDTPEYKLKLKLFGTFGPGPLDVYRRCGRGLKLVETIVPDLENLGRNDLALTLRGTARSA